MQVNNKLLKTTTDNRNSRFNEIDIAKGIGILLVVFFHIHYHGIACEIIYSFHMPLFFIISGFLFNSKKYLRFSSFIKQRMKTLICPYILFAFLSLVVWIFVSKLYWGSGISGIFDKDTMSNLFEIFIARQSTKMFNMPLWFVLCLFSVEIIYYFISKINRKSLILLIVVFLAGFGWYLESSMCFFDTSFLPWNLPSALYAISFYSTGNLMAPYIKMYFAQSPKYIFLIVFLLCVAIDIPLAIFNGHVTLGSRQLSNGFIFYITGIIGTAGILSLSKLTSFVKPLRWYGKNSFYIMSMHMPFLSVFPIIWSVVEKYTGMRLYNADIAVQCILPFIITIIACTVVTIVYLKVKNTIISLYNIKNNNCGSKIE